MNVGAILSGSLDLKATIMLAIAAIITAAQVILLGSTLDRKAGYFECSQCKTVFTPSEKTYLKGYLSVTPFSTHFHCPHCNTTTRCKRKFTR